MEKNASTQQKGRKLEAMREATPATKVGEKWGGYWRIEQSS